MNNNLAPIILFVYNRPWHTQQTIEALQRNDLAKESELFIFSDAPKNENAIEKVNEVREYIKTVDGFKKITIIEREKNWGLANSIIDGVTKIVNEYGKIIVLEDDLVSLPNFLKYMNNALVKYQQEKDVFSVTGYSFTNDTKNIDSTYFLSITSSWGWATWASKWSVFERDNIKIKDFISNKKNHYSFNFNGCYDFVSMAKMQIEGKLNSWAIYWYFCVHQNQGLTLYPQKSLIDNIGFDGSGTHCGISNEKEEIFINFIPTLTNIIKEKQEIRKIVVEKLKHNQKKFFLRIKNRTKSILKNKISASSKIKLFQLRDAIKLFLLKKDVGNNTYIDKTVHVTGWNYIKVGNNSAISEHTWINVNNRILNHKHIIIGNNCYIGRRNFFSSGWLIEIGSYCMTGLDCKFMGSDHIFDDPMKPYITTGTTNDKIIKIETNVWLGANVTVIGNITIGRGSIVGAGSLVNKSIPPFSIAIGNPCRVIKRYDFKQNKWIKIDEYNHESDNLIPTNQEYIEILNKEYANISMPLQACSKNFGDMF